MYKAKMLRMHPMIPEHPRTITGAFAANFTLKKYQTHWSCAGDIQRFCMCSAVAFMKASLNFSFPGKRKLKS